MAKQLQKLIAWQKATPILTLNPRRFRQDRLGNVIRWKSYGKNTPQGWVVDHIIPLARGETNSIQNIQALQTRANLRKGTSYPYRPPRRR